MPRMWASLISSHWLAITLVILLLFVGASVGREYARQATLRHQIESLQNEISAIEDKNQDLTSVISYLDTQKFTEEEARTNMGLQKPGEQVIVIQPLDGSSPATLSADVEAADNWQKWWWYFFEPQRLQTPTATELNHLPTRQIN